MSGTHFLRLCDDLVQRQQLEGWVFRYSQAHGRAPFVREAAAALRLSELEIGALMADGDALYLGHPGRGLPAQTIEIEEI